MMKPFLKFRQKLWILRRQVKGKFFGFLFHFIDNSMKRKNYILTIKGIKSKFYLPYIKTDLIQQRIYWEKNYFEKKELQVVCKDYNNGEIDKIIKNSVVLDIGTNIGNHTLYFLNECGAKNLQLCFALLAS